MGERDAARKLISDLVAAYNRKDLEAVASLYADDVTLWTTLDDERHGKEAVIAHVEELFTLLPDEQMTVDAVVTDGATVVVELTSRGKSAAGRDYEISFTEVLELEEGKIRSIKTYIDPDDVAEVID